MKMSVNVIEFSSEGRELPLALGERIFDTADTVNFLVAPWFDSQTPGMVIPEGYHMAGFRIFTLDNSITVYVCKGKLVSNDAR